ncbi:MAG: Asp-tRNA(Asn)/Glu-tRNA(Gln) amidotransferase GatCAB subunit B, partial [Synergistes sp.]|nr:Asp-tRNA(Asn)/Glu-tRNA(Gln) amidotransferase GatCAB subunit B [Synergistes sp.]
QITEQREMADYYEALVAAGAPANKAANWLRMEVLRLLNEDGLDITEFPIEAKELGTLIAKIDKKEISNTQGKDVLAAMYGEKLSLEAAMKKCGVSGDRLGGDSLKAIIEKVFASQPEAVETIKKGADKKGAKAKFLQGLVMRETRGSADPAETSRMIEEMLKG